MAPRPCERLKIGIPRGQGAANTLKIGSLSLKVKEIKLGVIAPSEVLQGVKVLGIREGEFSSRADG
jgi:hypothetical protein